MKGEQSHLKSLIDVIEKWCIENDMVLNHTKCKELIISFAKDLPNFSPLFVGEYCISRVSSAKVLGLNISSDLHWKLHVEHIVAKASKRLHFLRVLKRCGIGANCLIQVFFACIHSIPEYASQLKNYGATDYLKEEVERIQKRALRIIYPDLSYREAMNRTGIHTLCQRKKDMCVCRISKNFSDPNISCTI